jgi:hypothetical protein
MVVRSLEGITCRISLFTELILCDKIKNTHFIYSKLVYFVMSMIKSSLTLQVITMDGLKLVHTPAKQKLVDAEDESLCFLWLCDIHDKWLYRTQ